MDPAAYASIVSYARFSSKRQRRGGSEERQGDAAAAWAAEHGVTLSPLSVTDRGLSAFHGRHRDHGALGVLLAALEAGEVATPALLVIEAIDRLTRLPSTEGLQMIFSGLLAKGCDLLILERGQLITKAGADGDMGQLVQLVIDVAGAHAFSARLSRRMLAAHERGRQKIAAGEPIRAGQAPAWVELVDGRWALNNYADTIRRLLGLSETLGYCATARELNAEGHLSPRGKAWTSGGVQAILSAPAIAGGRPIARRDPDAVVWGYWPELISRAEWEALRRRIAARDGSPAHGGNQQAVFFIGQGVTVCAECGRPVGHRVCSYKDRQTGDRVKVRYARCRSRVDGTCSQPAVQLGPIQATILTRLASADLARLFPAEPSALGALQAQEDDLRRQLGQQQAAAANGREAIGRLLLTSPGSVDAVAQAVTAAEAEAARLDGELRALRVEIERLTSGGLLVLADELQTRTRELLQTFAAGNDTAEHRKAINGLMRRLGVRIVLDAKAQRLGLAVGDGELAWQPLIPDLAASALARGQAGVSFGVVEIDADDLKRAVEGLTPGQTEPVSLPFTLAEGDIEPGEYAAEFSTASPRN